jgi:hypothetical protein
VTVYPFQSRLLSRLLALVATFAMATAQSHYWHKPLADMIIHSDVPLFTDDYESIWPKHFSNDDGSFGCASRVAFGDWRVRRIDRPDEQSWYRFRNYGVFHCAAIVGSAEERSSLDSTSTRPSFFVYLGDTAGRSGLLELWAVQLGARPGSDYVLLSRPKRGGLVTSFTLLQQECPRQVRRRGGSLEILLTDYCAINSREALIGLATAMAQREPLGSLQLVSDKPDREDGR